MPLANHVMLVRTSFARVLPISETAAVCSMISCSKLHRRYARYSRRISASRSGS
jgi:hypothetical protein